MMVSFHFAQTIIKQTIFALILGLVLLIYPNHAMAAGEFATSYNITYDVGPSGDTQVEENIVLKNLTDRFYASSFALSIGATQISDVSASDSQGPIPVEVSRNNTKTNIVVKFTSQVVGKDKEYPWTLRFKSQDFAQAQGKVWQVSVPKISALENLDSYNLTLSTPVAFGDPTSITPEPKKQNEAGGKLYFYFTKEQLSDSGIFANFGTTQTFNFKMVFQAKNNGIIPALVRVPLPHDTQYQQVLLQKISPKPENVNVDGDGNYIGLFTVGRKESLKIEVLGQAKLFYKSRSIVTLSKSEEASYTLGQKYWEKDSPQIKTKLAEIFKDKDPKTNSEKARLIHKFVSTYLQYDQNRLKEKNFQRLGALTALSNPDKALCGEFTDLFITLARSAGIPARELIGYAYTSNADLRPLSFGENILHAWPEYFDPAFGWIMIDPTWENSTGGVDYFSKFDLNHISFLTRGLSSEEPYPASEVSVNFTETDIKPGSDIKLSIQSPQEILSAFPAKATVYVENAGNTASAPTILSLTAANLKIVDGAPLTVPLLPPFGSQMYQFDLRTGKFWESYKDVLNLKVGEQVIEKKITIKPFFAYRYLAYGVAGAIGMMVTVYVVILYLRLKASKNS